MPSILCLVLIWAAVSVAARLVLPAKPSADTTLELVNTRPGSAGNAEARQAWITSISSSISKLDLDSRHRVLLNPSFRSAFLEISPGDQSRLLQAIELRGMPDFIEGTKRWSRGRYERLTQPALADLEGLKPGSSAQFEAMLADPKPDAIAQAGIEAFLKQTNPVSRFEILPWIERMQKYSQQGR
jgi:hypothetical protein